MSEKKTTLFHQIREEEKHEDLSEQSWRSSSALRASIVVSTVLLCAVFYPNPMRYLTASAGVQPNTIGMPWQQEGMRAESAFPIYKSKKVYEEECAEVRKSSPFIFNSAQAGATQRASVYSTIDIAAPQARSTQGYKALLKALSDELSALNFINVSKSRLHGSSVLIHESGTSYRSLPIASLQDSADVIALMEIRLSKLQPAVSTQNMSDAVLAVMKPSLIFSTEETAAYEEASVRNVARTVGIVRKGEVIVQRGEIVSPETMLKLESYGVHSTETKPLLASVLSVIGAILHSALVIIILILFLYFLRPRIFGDNLKLLSLCGFVLMSACMAWLSLFISVDWSLEYLVFIPALSMLAAIYFDSRTAFICTVTMTLMFIAVRYNDFLSGFSILLAGTFASYSVRDLQSRTQLFRSIAFIFLGFFSVILARALESGSTPASQLAPLAASLVNAILSPLLTFAVISVSERYFNVSTDLKLRELDNINHPLLIEMSQKAPGTYQHTLAIANLVESAAFGIGANPLLARVGAYYHDIGKIPKSEYFIENQIELENKHDHLSPTKSAAIIRNHIQDGLELAAEYNLPMRVAEFIPMHHGTSVIKHFYAKAVEQANQDGSAVTELSFRYPGPKPSTKETALVMLADGVEAISRVTDDRDELAAGVARVFHEKIIDGQLNECDITMRELDVVKDLFIRNLAGAHHQRAAYKEIPATDSSATS